VAAQVVISEIAWMGSAADSNDEWIELLNRGSESVDVTGWTLSDGDAVYVTLSGTLSAGGCALLERTDDASVPGVSAFQIYTGALANGGRTLVLKDASGVTIDTVAGGENWSAIGGDNVGKDTPQRTDADEWITAPPTPGVSEAISGTTDVPARPASSVGASKRSGNGRVVYAVPKPSPSEPEPLTVAISAPLIGYVHQPIEFTLSVRGPGETILNSLAYDWNFGDTFTSDRKEPTHAFAYPGEYVVIAEAAYAAQEAAARHEITILPVSFALARGAGGEILLTNRAPHEVDIGGFTLQGASSFVFPKHTILKAGKTLTIPSEHGGTAYAATLLDMAHLPLARLEGPHAVPRMPSRSIGSAASSTSAVSSSSMNTEEKPEIPTGVIHIGTSSSEHSSPGPVARLFRKIGNLFGL
jgi:hypothetical protein